MRTARTSPRSAGFTLIELMIVVTIIGLVASVAFPIFTRVTTRSKQVERDVVMNQLERSVKDYFDRRDDPDLFLMADWNPPGPPTGEKRWFDPKVLGWDQLPTKPEGLFRFQYYVFGMRQAGKTHLLIGCRTDLNGNSKPYWLIREWDSVTDGWGPMIESLMTPDEL